MHVGIFCIYTLSAFFLFWILLFFFLCLVICFSVQILTYCHLLEAILDEKEAFPQSSKSESFVLFPLVHEVQFTMTYFSIVNFYATSSTKILPL